MSLVRYLENYMNMSIGKPLQYTYIRLGISSADRKKNDTLALNPFESGAAAFLDYHLGAPL